MIEYFFHKVVKVIFTQLALMTDWAELALGLFFR
jgi:hypothetical protein